MIFLNKFGIFNLINSFYDLYKKGKPSNTTEQAPTTTSSMPQIIPALSNLLGSLSNSQQKTEPSKTSPPPLPKKAPLQQGMLSARHSHDNFVKKVTAKELEKV